MDPKVQGTVGPKEEGVVEAGAVEAGAVEPKEEGVGGAEKGHSPIGVVPA